MDFVTSLCKAGVEITSSFLVGLRIMRITQRTLKVWTASAVPKAFPSRAAYRWQRGAPAVHRDTLDNPGRAAAEEEMEKIRSAPGGLQQVRKAETAPRLPKGGGCVGRRLAF